MSKISFVEAKRPDPVRITHLLKLSALANSWANRGPVYQLLAERYASHIRRPAGTAIVPLANGGVALEVMARRLAAKAGRPLRWVASAYSFQNLGRGYFSDIRFLDCDARGLLDIAELRALDPDEYDGIVLTNPFGLYAASLTEFAAVARSRGKALIVDNAAGLHSDVAELPWQSFSLHHTKPYGAGEGGLALVPEDEAEAVYQLVNYAPDIETPEHWLQNGKLSDISAAYLLDRLDRFPEWGPPNLEQRERVMDIARACGLMPLAEPETDIPMTSLPFLSPGPIPAQAIEWTRHLTYAKYYRPLADLPGVCSLYSRLVNIPCHGDVAQLTDAELAADMMRCIGNRIRAVAS